MKKFSLLTLLMLVLALAGLNAQNIAPTSGSVPSANPPASWTGATASTSSKSLYQGNAARLWKNGPLPGVPGQANAAFLSLYSNNNVITEASTPITGLVPGTQYEVSYHIMAASAQLPAGFTDVAYAAEVEVDVTSGAENQYNFNAANSSIWIPGKIKFTANAAQMKLAFRILGQTAKGSIVNLSVAAGAVKPLCGAGPEVPLSKTSMYNKCFQPYVNLNEAIAGAIPAGLSLRWFTNNTHTGWAILDPTKVTTAGSYYAFFFNGSCFTSDLSTAKVTVSIHPPLPGNGQVILTAAALTNECPVTNTVDLTKAFTSPVPVGAVLLWYDNPTHSGLPVLDPAHAPVTVNKYYAFYYDIGNDCYNTNNSTAFVSITQRPCEQANAANTAALSVYPNPATDKIRIESAQTDVKEVQISNSRGLVVYKGQRVPSDGIDIRHLSGGTYTVKLLMQDGSTNSAQVLVVR